MLPGECEQQRRAPEIKDQLLVAGWLSDYDLQLYRTTVYPVAKFQNQLASADEDTAHAWHVQHNV